jgi:Tol biopolymer transport system component
MDIHFSLTRILRPAAGLLLAQTLLVGGAMAAAHSRPRGPQIAFVSGPHDETSIYLLERSRGLAARLTGSHTHACCLAWSPDGNYLTYVEQGEQSALYSLNLDCTGAPCGRPQPLLPGIEPSAVQWSPDGEHIAFESKKELGYWTIYVADADGANQHPVSQPRLNAHWPTWSPDGKQLAFTAVQDGRMEMFVVDRGGQNLRRILSDSVKYLYQYTVWSPDGHSVAYVSNQTGARDVYRIDVASYQQTALTHNVEAKCCLAWSPDGGALVFAAHANREATSLYELTLSTGALRRLTGSIFSVSFPAWRPG